MREYARYVSETGIISRVLVNEAKEEYRVTAVDDSGTAYTAVFVNLEDADEFAKEWIRKWQK